MPAGFLFCLSVSAHSVSRTIGDKQTCSTLTNGETDMVALLSEIAQGFTVGTINFYIASERPIPEISAQILLKRQYYTVALQKRNGLWGIGDDAVLYTAEQDQRIIKAIQSAMGLKTPEDAFEALADHLDVVNAHSICEREMAKLKRNI